MNLDDEPGRAHPVRHRLDVWRAESHSMSMNQLRAWSFC
jgi:hypothetical protein